MAALNEYLEKISSIENKNAGRILYLVSITSECKAIKGDIFLMDVLAPGKRKLVKR